MFVAILHDRREGCKLDVKQYIQLKINITFNVDKLSDDIAMCCIFGTRVSRTVPKKC
jgi:hypothetical protein